RLPLDVVEGVDVILREEPLQPQTLGLRGEIAFLRGHGRPPFLTRGRRLRRWNYNGEILLLAATDVKALRHNMTGHLYSLTTTSCGWQQIPGWSLPGRACAYPEAPPGDFLGRSRIAGRSALPTLASAGAARAPARSP